MYIPSDTKRIQLFKDCMSNLINNENEYDNFKIFILLDDNNTVYEYDSSTKIKIDLNNGIITRIPINKKLNDIHSKLIIKSGDIDNEIPMQIMCIDKIPSHSRVLEIGGHNGRISLIIASILDNQNNLVVLESNTTHAEQLKENRDANNFNFHIDNLALSKRKAIQQGWYIMPSEQFYKSYEWVNIITFEEIKKKYNMDFDILVVDCKDNFYYILKDMPNILDNIKIIIIKNDFYDIYNKKYVDEILIKNKFYIYTVEQANFYNIVIPPEKMSCYSNYYEVWNKKINLN